MPKRTGRPWQHSSRRSRLPANWASLRRHILERDAYRCHVIGCDAVASEVDHLRPGDDHSLGNLAAICTHHHRRKSSAEGNEARARTARPGETHPGLT
jgi:5-methylcytosine-specific restriction protein A